MPAVGVAVDDSFCTQGREKRSPVESGGLGLTQWVPCEILVLRTSGDFFLFWPYKMSVSRFLKQIQVFWC